MPTLGFFHQGENDGVTKAFTPSPPHPLTPSPLHPFTPSLFHPFTPSPPHPLTRSPLHHCAVSFRMLFDYLGNRPRLRNQIAEHVEQQRLRPVAQRAFWERMNVDQ